MGSDDGNKNYTTYCSTCAKRYAIRSALIRWTEKTMNLRCLGIFHKWKLNLGTFVCGIILIILLIAQCATNTTIFRMYVSPEYYTTDTFQRRSPADYDYLPSHCRPIAKEFDACQQQKQARVVGKSSTIRWWSQYQKRPTIVFACHRVWCHSYFGHCEPCSGLGDRYRFLISQIDNIFSITTKSSTIHKIYDEKHRPYDRKTTSLDDYICYTNIQIDAPTNGLQQIQSSLYIDPGSWFGEFFHFRSYSVSKREVLPYKEILLQQQQQQQQSTYYTHFTPNGYGINIDYNACYFHIVFQPDIQLQNDIQNHRDQIHQLSSGGLSPTEASGNAPPNLSNNIVTTTKTPITTTIGIHFRTGDAIAFGIENADERVHSNQLISGWNQMYDCSVQLMKRLVHHEGNTNYDHVRFYLATDNPIVKGHVRQHHTHHHSNESKSLLSIIPFVPVYVTDIDPDSYLRGNSGDRTALLELYLLSGCDGIVVNILPATGYNGTAAVVSQFSTLAKKIGFIPNTNFYKCNLS